MQQTFLAEEHVLLNRLGLSRFSQAIASASAVSL
jgi:hypothetical protein